VSNTNPEYATAINEAYDGLGTVYDFYWQQFNRNSIDDAGLQLAATVHYGQQYDNAYWNGQQMIFGDGDQVTFTRFTDSYDVVGHELTHGVTQYEAGLIYWGETGALNESISDVFGTLVKQFAYGQSVDKADWLIGNNIMEPLPAQHAPNAVRTAIRSMAAPGTAYMNDPVLGTDPQPAHMNNYVRTMQDNGGVHTNSGIPNHAFYLAATSLGGNAWETVGPVWYQTLKSPALSKTAKFQDFAALSVETASALDASGNSAQAVATAWSQVGIST
jgi:Zn-dependent metalloprotease